MAADFDFHSDEFQNAPGETFTRMQGECPFHKSEQYGWYSVFRFDDIANIVRDNATFSARFGPGPAYADPESAPVLVSADPPLHGKQKAAIIPAFNAKLISALEGPIRGFVNQCFDAVIESGECDVVQDIAVPLPLWVICELLDIDFESHKVQLREWIEILAGSVFPTGEAMEAERIQKVMDLQAFFDPHIAGKVAKDEVGEDAGSDLLGLLAKGRVEGERIGNAEIKSFAQFLLVAGSATTTNLIGNFVKLMLDHPKQLAKLRSDPALMDQAIEEVLRFDAPVHGLFRTNNEEVQLGDHTVPPDSKICLMWGSANRDPAQFEDPNTFNIERDLKTLRKNMTFGQGLHKCLGAPLARLECKVFAEEFLRRIPQFESNGDPVSYPYSTLNGLDNLPIRFAPGEQEG